MVNDCNQTYREKNQRKPDFSSALGLLTHLNSEQLQAYLNDDDKFESVVNDAQELNDIKNKKEMLIASNRSLAEFNLAKKPFYTLSRNEVQQLTEERQQLFNRIEAKTKELAQRELNQRLEQTLASLIIASDKIEGESEELATKFLDGAIDVEGFLKQFSPQRKIMHLRRVNVEKMTVMVPKRTKPPLGAPPAFDTAASGSIRRLASGKTAEPFFESSGNGFGSNTGSLLLSDSVSFDFLSCSTSPQSTGSSGSVLGDSLIGRGGQSVGQTEFCASNGNEPASAIGSLDAAATELSACVAASAPTLPHLESALVFGMPPKPLSSPFAPPSSAYGGAPKRKSFTFEILATQNMMSFRNLTQNLSGSFRSPPPPESAALPFPSNLDCYREGEAQSYFGSFKSCGKKNKTGKILGKKLKN